MPVFFYVFLLMRKLYPFIFLFFVALLCACKPDSYKGSAARTVTVSDFSFELPEACATGTGKKMEKMRINCKEVTPIKVFNFGAKPVMVEANLERWKSQLDTITSIEETTYHNNTVFYYAINGMNGEEKITSYALIVPSSSGPYFLKTMDNTSNATTKLTFEEIVESIKYLK